jgi:hypothetical protein
MDFSISEMDLSICAPKNNHINCVIIILNFVNLSLKENVIISVFILKIPILQPYGNNSISGFFFLRIVFVCSQNGHHLREDVEKVGNYLKEDLAKPCYKSKHESTKRSGWLEWRSHGLPTSITECIHDSASGSF